MFGLMFFPDRAAGLREMRRVLRPGGRAIVSSWVPFDGPFGELLKTARELIPGLPLGGGRPPLADPDEIRAELAAAGFANLTVETVQHQLTAPSFDAFWDSMERTNAPLVLLKHRLGPRWAELAPKIRARVRTTLGDGPLVVGRGASSASARREDGGRRMKHERKPVTVQPPGADYEIKVVGDRPTPLRDFYHGLLKAPWWATVVAISATFLVANAVFAFAFLVVGGVTHAAPGLVPGCLLLQRADDGNDRLRRDVSRLDGRQRRRRRRVAGQPAAHRAGDRPRVRQVLALDGAVRVLAAGGRSRRSTASRRSRSGSATSAAIRSWTRRSGW